MDTDPPEPLPTAAVFIPRAHPPRTHRDSQPALRAQHAQLTHVLRTTAAHLPAPARASLQHQLRRLEAELRGRGEAEDVQGWVLVPRPGSQARAPGGEVERLRGAMAHLGILDHASSSISTHQEAPQHRQMTFRQQLAQGIVNAGGSALAPAPAPPAKLRRGTAAAIRLLEPSSAALAEAEALQAADHLRKAGEDEEHRQRRSHAQRSDTAMQTDEAGPSQPPDGQWSFYTPEALFGGDEDADEEADDEALAASGTEMSLSGSTTALPAEPPRVRGESGVDEDEDEIPDISAAEQHRLEAAQEAAAVREAEQPGRWLYEAVAARERAAEVAAAHQQQEQVPLH